MKLRFLLSLLFIIATTFTAVHEIEHITGEHDTTSCEVCIVDDHSLAYDGIDDLKDTTLFSFESIRYKKIHCFAPTNTTNQSNAPPYLS